MAHQMILSVVLLFANGALEGLEAKVFKGVALQVGSLGELGVARCTPEALVNGRCVLREAVERSELVEALIAGELLVGTPLGSGAALRAERSRLVATGGLREEVAQRLSGWEGRSRLREDHLWRGGWKHGHGWRQDPCACAEGLWGLTSLWGGFACDSPGQVSLPPADLGRGG